MVVAFFALLGICKVSVMLFLLFVRILGRGAASVVWASLYMGSNTEGIQLHMLKDS